MYNVNDDLSDSDINNSDPTGPISYNKLSPVGLGDSQPDTYVTTEIAASSFNDFDKDNETTYFVINNTDSDTDTRVLTELAMPSFDDQL